MVWYRRLIYPSRTRKSILGCAWRIQMTDTNNNQEELARLEAERKAAEEAEAARKAAGNNGDDDLVKKLVEERVAEQLKEIKGKLDNAFSARDEALRKLKEAEEEKKAAEIKRLQEEGKHKEVLEMQLAEERAAREALEKRNTELSRDVTVRAALSGLEFRNDKAAEIAFKEITSQLTQNENGVWVHKSGVSVNDFIGAFAKDEDQSFLFKTKTNNGGGSSSNTAGGTNTAGKPKSLFEMSQEEVLKMAREGKLPKRN